LFLVSEPSPETIDPIVRFSSAVGNRHNSDLVAGDSVDHAERKTAYEPTTSVLRARGTVLRINGCLPDCLRHRLLKLDTQF
jgi:hypothetical protein